VATAVIFIESTSWVALSDRHGAIVSLARLARLARLQNCRIDALLCGFGVIDW